jgi:hypothetical protein
MFLPTLFRFVTMVAVLAALVAGAIFALATFVGPNTREMSITLPKDRFESR